MITKYFTRYSEWGTNGMYYLTPGPMGDEDMRFNNFCVNFDTDIISLRKENGNTTGKAYNLFLDYDASRGVVLYGGRPLDAVGCTIYLKEEKSSLKDFYDRVKELDSKENVRAFLETMINKRAYRMD